MRMSSSRIGCTACLYAAKLSMFRERIVYRPIVCRPRASACDLECQGAPLVPHRQSCRLWWIQFWIDTLELKLSSATSLEPLDSSCPTKRFTNKCKGMSGKIYGYLVLLQIGR